MPSHCHYHRGPQSIIHQISHMHKLEPAYEASNQLAYDLGPVKDDVRD